MFVVLHVFMKNAPRFLILLVAIVTGSLGYFAGSFSRKGELVEEKSATETFVGKETPYFGVEAPSLAMEETVLESGVDLESLLGNTNRREKAYEFTKYLETIGLEDIERVRAELDKLGRSPHSNGLQGLLVKRWAELDGPAAFEYTQNMKGVDGVHRMSYAIEGWAKNEPEKAWESYMMATNNGAKYASRMRDVLGSIARDNLQNGVTFAGDLSDPRIQKHAFFGVVEAASESGNHSGLLSELLTLDDSKHKPRMVEAVFQHWIQDDADMPFAALEKLSDPALSEVAMSGLMKGWAAQDGKGAMEYILANESDPVLANQSLEVVKQWARYSKASEMDEIVTTIEKSSKSNELLEAIIFPMASADPEMALEWVEHLKSESGKAENTARVLYTWGRSNPEGAKDYFLQLQDVDRRLTSTFVMAGIAMNNDEKPEEIISMLTNYDTDESKDRALSSMSYAAVSSQYDGKSAGLRKSLLEYAHANPKLGGEDREEILERLEGIK